MNEQLGVPLRHRCDFVLEASVFFEKPGRPVVPLRVPPCLTFSGRHRDLAASPCVLLGGQFFFLFYLIHRKFFFLGIRLVLFLYLADRLTFVWDDFGEQQLLHFIMEGDLNMENVDHRGSPTELAESSAEDNEVKGPPCPLDLDVKLEKRKREVRRRRVREGRAKEVRACDLNVPDSEDEDESDNDSPTKRPQQGSEAPLSSREIRDLLFSHVTEMKEAWRSFQGRLDKVESEQLQQQHEMINIRTRTAAVEKTGAQLQKNVELQGKNLDELAEDVKNMKVQITDLKNRPPEAPREPPLDDTRGRGAPVPSDPWAEYARRRGDLAQGNPSSVGEQASGSGDRQGDVLTDDEKKTLVVGGWARDTKRSIIEAESATVLAMEGMKALIDVEKLAIYGPRRSVGMMKFQQREGETFADVKNRMWAVIRLVANAKIELPSTNDFGEAKLMWASFTKTRSARLKSSHVSMIRRVTCDLAFSSKNAEGGIKNLANTQQSAYDCDWNLGTIWCSAHKLGSATHRSPKDSETILMPGGWVDLNAISATAGCSVDEAKSAFEKELLGSSCGRHRWGRISQWNLAGQKIGLLDVAARDVDVIFAQEVARGKEGWDSYESDEFHWILHRHADQWRGVGLAFSKDRFDCVTHKVSTPRGIWALVRINGLGRIVCGTLHAPSGVTNAIYQAAVCEFFGKLPAKWRQYPLLCGVDANEVPQWELDENAEVYLGHSGENLNVLMNEAVKINSHMILTRGIACGDLVIVPERRLTINTDHALLYAEIYVRRKTDQLVWGNDSRARWVQGELPDTLIVDEDDIAKLGRECTRPRRSCAYRDPEEVKSAIDRAKSSGKKSDWKCVHRLRKEARKAWEEARLSRILLGGWDEFRALQNEKKKHRGWWGELLQEKSSRQLTLDVTRHLESKMVTPEMHRWDEELDTLIAGVPQIDNFAQFSVQDIRVELQGMKCRSAVGPDGIGVHLLRELASHAEYSHQLADLINHIVATQQTPRNWNVSFLALLAKCSTPRKPGDLRPIAVSSAFNKLVNRLVCSRILPHLRRGSRISACGRGRQAADLIGATSRIRDVVHEWRVPCLFCKLDVAGAFDRVDRRKVAQLLKDRLMDKRLTAELRYILGQLHTHELLGRVPGGHAISVSPNTGIKQGAPESAEIFGILVDSMLTELVDCSAWKRLGRPHKDLDIDLMFYQDDVFLVETDLTNLIRRIRVVNKCLGRAGLKLATEKTKIIASPEYGGPRKAKVADEVYEVAPAGESVQVLGVSFSFHASISQQAEEFLGRARAAAAIHQDVLCASGPWKKKTDMIRSLVESRWSWAAGSVFVFANMAVKAGSNGIKDRFGSAAPGWCITRDSLPVPTYAGSPLEKYVLVEIPTKLVRNEWYHLASDRVAWTTARDRYLACWDVKWIAVGCCSAWLEFVDFLRTPPLLLLAEHADTEPMPSSTQSSLPAAGAHQSLPWNYNQYISFMSAAWDEEVSLAEQLNDYVETEAAQQGSSSSSSTHVLLEPVVQSPEPMVVAHVAEVKLRLLVLFRDETHMTFCDGECFQHWLCCYNVLGEFFYECYLPYIGNELIFVTDLVGTEYTAVLLDGILFELDINSSVYHLDFRNALACDIVVLLFSDMLFLVADFSNTAIRIRSMGTTLGR
ncbi:pol [Symbiodinium sp. CCMP2592]|nr:pol [Symbiodinium sp. CCMP2592]